MKATVTTILLLLAATASCAESARQFIPTGIVKARVMQLAVSPRAAELTAKFQASVASNKEWWLEYVKGATPGQPLPYNTRMGLTEVEYAEYLQLARAQELTQVGEAPLQFAWPSKEQVVVTSEGALPDFGSLRIDLATDSVETPYGKLTDRSEINNQSPDSPTGPWRGVQWKRAPTSGDLASGIAAKLALGRLVPSGEGILYFDAKEVVSGSLKRRSLFVLFYPLP